MITLDTLLEPALFWYWNVTPSHDDIKKRLDDFGRKGIRALYIHPMPDDFRHGDFHGGMKTTYPSEEYFALVAFACEQMRRREMILWLYDEGGWPSGAANGAVVRADPRYGIWTLKRSGEKFLPSQLHPQILYPDLMNPAATQCFIELTHEKYRQYVGSEFGRTVLGIFTDEPRLWGRLGTDTIPWSPLLPDAFAKGHGYPLEDILPRLFAPDPADEPAQLARRHYIHIASTLIADNYYRPLRQWCESNHLLFEGHHSGEDGWSHHGEYFGDFFQQARHYHIPGVDAIWRQIFPGKPGGNYVSLASSLSWLQGKRCALSESCNVYGAGLTLEQMRWIAAFQIVRGVNKIALMPCLESTLGARRISTCADFSPRTPLWRDFDLLIEFVRKAARFSAGGEACPRVGVLYRSELVAENEAAGFDQLHERLCERIHDSMAGLLFVGVDDLRNGELETQRLRLGSIHLSALVIHATLPFAQDEWKVLADLAHGGLRMIWIGDRASWHSFRSVLAVGEEPDNIEWIARPEDLDLAELSPLTFDRKVTGVRLLRLHDGGQYQFLFFNQNPFPVEFSFQPEGSGSALKELLLEDGAIGLAYPFRVRDEWYEMRLHPGQMRALLSAPADETAATPAWNCVGTLPLKVEWEIEEEERYVIREDIEIEKPVCAKFAGQLGDYSEWHPEFSGSLLYRTSFSHAHQADSRIVLDLGQVYYAAEVLLNGQNCGRRAWSPFLFDITAALHDGENHLQIRVTNTLANQWARPAVRERDFRLWRNQYLEKSAPFIDQSCHAGLVGPVVLRVEQ